MHQLFHYKMRQFYYKMRQVFHYKMRQKFIKKCISFFITKCNSFITKCDSHICHKMHWYIHLTSDHNKVKQSEIQEYHGLPQFTPSSEIDWVWNTKYHKSNFFSDYFQGGVWCIQLTSQTKSILERFKKLK